jgi:hypothetical protein
MNGGFWKHDVMVSMYESVGVGLYIAMCNTILFIKTAYIFNGHVK